MSKWTRCFACLRVRRLATHIAMPNGTAMRFAPRRSLRQPKRHANHPSSSHPPDGSHCAHSAFPSSSAASEAEGKVHRVHAVDRYFAAKNPRIPHSAGGRALRAPFDASLRAASCGGSACPDAFTARVSASPDATSARASARTRRPPSALVRSQREARSAPTRRARCAPPTSRGSAAE